MNLKELFNDAIPIIKDFAPSIAAAIGGPLGVAAGYAIPILFNAFNCKPGDFNQLVSNITQDSQAQAKLENIEQEHGYWIRSLMGNINDLSSAEINVKLQWKTDTK